MAYFRDLTECAYLGTDKVDDYLNIGWLSREHEFTTGQVSSRAMAKLEILA